MKPTTAIKAIIFSVAVLLLMAVPAHAQVSRLNFASQTTNGQCVPGSTCPILAVPGSQVMVCVYAITGCGSIAATYSDATGVTPCPTYAQVSPGCVATTDTNGNGGVWVNSGNYSVYFNFGTPQQLGPFYYTSGGGGGGGGGSCPQGPNGSVQISNGANCIGSGNLTFVGQELVITGSSTASTALLVQSGSIEGTNGIVSIAGGYYAGFESSTDGINVPGYQVVQNAAANAGGYIVFNGPITYNPYNQSGVCLDQWGNPVQQPLPITGGSFGTYASVLWVGSSPSLPSSPTSGCPTPGGPPLPVNPNNALNGLNTNSYFFARGGLATDDAAYNSIQSLLGGIYVHLGATIDQAVYPASQTSCAALNTPGGTYGGFAYQAGPNYCYWRNDTHTWNSFNFSSGGGVGCTVSAPSASVLFSNGTGCTGSANIEADVNGNLTLAGSGAVLNINGMAGGVNVTADGAYDSIQTVGGFNANLSIATNAGLTIVGATSQTKNLAEFYSHTPTLLASISSAGAGLFAGLTLSNVTGSAQCLHANSSGVVSGTGSDCGSGGGGGAPTYLTFAAATSETFGTLGYAGAAINCYTSAGAWTIPASITGLNTTTPTVNFSSAFTGTCAAVLGGGGGGGGTPGTPLTSVQVNSGGVFTGYASFEYASNVLTLIGPNAMSSTILQVQSDLVGQQATMGFFDGTTEKWQLGKNTDNTFFIYDSVAAQNFLTEASGSTANLVLTPPSGEVYIAGKTGLAGEAIANGYGQADGGYLATSGVCVSYQCIQTPTGGFSGKSINLGVYVAMASATAVPTMGDNWCPGGCTVGSGVFYYNTAGAPTFYFDYGVSPSTLAFANVEGNEFIGTSSAISFEANGPIVSGATTGEFYSAATGLSEAFVAGTCFSAQGNGLVQLQCSASGLNVTASTAFNSIQTSGGTKAVTGVTIGQTVSGTSSNAALYLNPAGGNCSSLNLPSLPYGGWGYSGGSTFCYFNNGTSTWNSVNLATSGGGVSSLTIPGGAVYTGALTLQGTGNEIVLTQSGGNTFTLATPQPIGIATNFAANSYTSGCGAAGTNQYAFTSCATGVSLAFTTSNSDFEVDGQGDISGAGSINMTGSGSAYKIQGTTFLTALNDLTVNTATIQNGMGVTGTTIFSGNVYAAGYTNTISIGTLGAFYTQPTGMSYSAWSCASVSDGRFAITSDGNIVMCLSGARYRVALTNY